MKKTGKIGFKSILTTLILLTISITAWAQWREKIIRVQFPKGETSAQYKDTLRGRIWHIYKLRANAGQTMSLEVVEGGANNDVVFYIIAPDNSLPMGSAGESA